ncbi:hypothetical protein ACV07N_06270 [Roseivirga echinicomitans]
MKRITLYFAILLLPNIAFSQTGNIDFRQGANGKFSIRSRVSMDINIPYSPHVYEDSRQTKIELLDGTVVEGYYKYNVETESLESFNDNVKHNLNTIRKFTFLSNGEYPEELFTNVNLVWPESEYGGFFKSVPGSDYLFEKYYLEFKPKDYDPTMDVGNPYDRVEMSSEFYAQLNGEWQIIPQSKKPFIELMSNYVGEQYLKKFIRQNKIKTEVAEDVGKVMNWIVTRNEN